MTETRRRIAVVTGTRAEYGLLRAIIGRIHADPELELLLYVTGAHLASDYGRTVSEIEADGFPIQDRVDILLAADHAAATGTSMGLALMNFADRFAKDRPDLLVVLGDRYEIFSVAAAALVCRVPIAHLHGGETTEGAYDEAFRHSITKMSALHFTSAEEYRRRVIQLGEAPERVHNVGAPGLDAIRELDLLSREECEGRLDFRFRESNVLVTYHPETLSGNLAEAEAPFRALLQALAERPELGVVLTYANADTGGRRINELAEAFAAGHADRVVIRKSLGQLLFLSVLQHVQAMVGNSSSGIIEAPSFGIATINLGQRQAGRVRAASILDSGDSLADIQAALDRGLSAEFQERCKAAVNPHGDGQASERIFQIIKTAPLEEALVKRFHDLPIA